MVGFCLPNAPRLRERAWQCGRVPASVRCMSRAFRIKIRGVFKDLTAEQRAELLAAAAEHDALTAGFTPEGHVSYDITARPFFTFRFADSGESEEDLAAATARAEAA